MPLNFLKAAWKNLRPYCGNEETPDKDHKFKLVKNIVVTALDLNFEIQVKDGKLLKTHDHELTTDEEHFCVRNIKQ